MGGWVRGRGCGERRSSASYKHLGESICTGASDVAFRRMKRHVVDRFLELLSVSCELLDAGFTLQVPQTDGAVVTCGEDDELKGYKLSYSSTEALQVNTAGRLTRATSRAWLQCTYCLTWDKVHSGPQLSWWLHPGGQPWSESASHCCCQRIWCVGPPVQWWWSEVWGGWGPYWSDRERLCKNRQWTLLHPSVLPQATTRC